MNNTSKKKIGTIVAIVFILVVIIVGALAMVNHSDTTNGKEAAGSSEIRISITEEGFSPSTVTITHGTTVVWVNDTASPRKVGANPYPDASSLPGLKSDVIAPGESYSFTFNDAGTVNFADYTQPTASGSIKVK